MAAEQRTKCPEIVRIRQSLRRHAEEFDEPLLLDLVAAPVSFCPVGQHLLQTRSRVKPGKEILDLKPRGIRVNAISPGPIKTPGLVELAGPDSVKRQAMLDYMATTVPLGRVGEPDEVAKAAVFLASDDASYIAGIELFVDGGQAQI